MLLSAAVIVRDLAGPLESCLVSVHGLVDELVVVDTGSCDDSVEVARRHGAIVDHVPWTGDFSIPRNRSLDLASGEWILYIDADEQARRGDHAAVRARLAHAGDCVALRPRFTPRVGWTPYREFRLWRRRPDIRFRGAMHESVVPDLQRVAAGEGLRIEPLDELTIDHFGYEGDQSAKRARDEPLLRAELERRPDRTYLYDHLARVLAGNGDSAGAVAVWQQGIAVARAHDPHPDDRLLYCNLIFHLLAGGPSAELAALTDEAQARFPGLPVIELAAASQELATGRAADALPRAEWLVGLDEDAVIETDVSCDERVIGEWAWHLLGRCRFALGDDAGAADAFRHAETADPANPEYTTLRRLAEARASGG